MDSKDWMIRVMEIRNNPASASVEDILKLADDYFYNLYFSKPLTDQQHILQIGQRLSSGPLNKE
jgi:hypothetical protein